MKKILFYFAKYFKRTNPLRRLLRSYYVRLFVQKTVTLDPVIGRELLLETHKILRTLNLKHCLTFGTCLGAVREKNFIKIDEDMDIGLFLRTQEELTALLQALVDNPYITKFIVLGTLDHGLVIKTYHNNTWVDLYNHYEDGNEVWMAGWAEDANGKDFLIKHTFEKRLFDHLEPFTFLGIETFTPHPVDAYLTTCYGDWRTPVKTYDWKTDSHCTEDHNL